jgi:hypothetical protein
MQYHTYTVLQYYSRGAYTESHLPHLLHLNWGSHPVPTQPAILLSLRHYATHCCISELLSPGEGLWTGRRFSRICSSRSNTKLSKHLPNSGIQILYSAHRYSKAVDFIVRLSLLHLFQQDRQCTYKSNIEARSRNHCYRVSAVLHIPSVCL